MSHFSSKETTRESAIDLLGQPIENLSPQNQISRTLLEQTRPYIEYGPLAPPPRARAIKSALLQSLKVIQPFIGLRTQP
jgi:hypothetical protein